MNVQEKCSPAQMQNFFNGAKFPLASAALYICELRLYDSSRSEFSIKKSFRIFPAQVEPVRRFGNENETKKNNPLR
jgi:hypothetical protein